MDMQLTLKKKKEKKIISVPQKDKEAMPVRFLQEKRS